ncbi:hemK methyltransferase 1 [Lycorma delicatula]|uniref:hemK methyltransferase 1 n=1 Tax=Lycorma delicatula TaxID=130591 RepID=UPI003F516899
MRLLVHFLIASNFRRFLCVQAETKFTVKDAILHWEKVFKKQNIPEPENSAGYLVAHVLGETRIVDILVRENEILSKKEKEKLEKLCECRLARMPVQYIIKQWDFRYLNLLMAPPVFIPRPETEELINIILKYIKKSKPKPTGFLEVGCGTGAISLSLVTECKSKLYGIAIDKSYLAVKLASMNVAAYKIDTIKVAFAELTEDGNLTEVHLNGSKPFMPDDKFDFIVSNPPYIPRKKLRDLQPEIKLFEDLRAVDGGDDGMDVIKSLMKLTESRLSEGGSLFMEIDPSHPKLIEKWIDENYDRYKLKLKKVYKDIFDKKRFVHIIK